MDFSTIYHTELAIANPSLIAKNMLSRTVREHGVKVCVTGEGADEGFGGYPYFKNPPQKSPLHDAGFRVRFWRSIIRYFLNDGAGAVASIRQLAAVAVAVAASSFSKFSNQSWWSVLLQTMTIALLQAGLMLIQARLKKSFTNPSPCISGA